MKISALTYLFNRYSLERVFELFHYYELDGIELWGGRPHAFVKDLDDHTINYINNLSFQYQLPISMFVPEILAYPYHPCSRLKSERDDAIEYIKQSIQVTKKMNCELMQVTIPHPGYGRNKTEVWDQLIVFFKRIVEEAEKQGVRIVVESLSPSEGGNLLANADDLACLFSIVESSNLSSMIDVVPPFIAQEPYDEYFIKLKGKIDYIHLCNSDGCTEWHMSLDDPRGKIPFSGFFNLIKRNKYTGWLSLELLSPYFGNPELFFTESLRLLRSFI